MVEERKKKMNLGKWAALYLVLAVVTQITFILLKAFGAINWSWHYVWYPGLITLGLIGIVAALVGFAIMTINAEEKEKVKQEEEDE